MGKTRHLFKKIRYTKGIFHAKMSTIKDRDEIYEVDNKLTITLANYCDVSKHVFSISVPVSLWMAVSMTHT